MTIKFACPGCHVALQVPDPKGGQKAKCPKCGTALTIPRPQPSIPEVRTSNSTIGPPSDPHDPLVFLGSAAHENLPAHAPRVSATQPKSVASRRTMFIAASVAFVFLIGGAWWLFRLSVTNDDASSTDEAASAAPTRKLSDSLFGTWKLVEKRGGPPTISDEIKGTLVLEEGGAGILTIYGELFPMTFTVDDPRHPAKIICRRADANEPLVLSIDSFAPPRLVLKQSYTRMTFSVLGGNPEKAELVETQVYEKQKDFALPRAPKAVAALRQLGAAVLLDDNGDVDFVDLYPIAAISDTKPPTSQITDDDLKHLSGLTALRNLRAPSCRITNAGLSHLTSLRALRMLKLHENAISDDGLRAIAPLINLRELLLHSTSISDAGLIHIQKLQRLRHLGLASTQITDRGLQAVSTLRDMEDLNLHNTQVTDQGLKYLGELTKLKKLYLSNTKVTDKGVKELQARIPLCEINH